MILIWLWTVRNWSVIKDVWQCATCTSDLRLKCVCLHLNLSTCTRTWTPIVLVLYLRLKYFQHRLNRPITHRNTMQCNAIQYDTIQRSSLIFYFNTLLVLAPWVLDTSIVFSLTLRFWPRSYKWLWVASCAVHIKPNTQRITRHNSTGSRSWMELGWVEISAVHSALIRYRFVSCCDSHAGIRDVQISICGICAYP